MTSKIEWLLTASTGRSVFGRAFTYRRHRVAIQQVLLKPTRLLQLKGNLEEVAGYPEYSHRRYT